MYLGSSENFISTFWASRPPLEEKPSLQSFNTIATACQDRGGAVLRMVGRRKKTDSGSASKFYKLLVCLRSRSISKKQGSTPWKDSFYLSQPTSWGWTSWDRNSEIISCPLKWSRNWEQWTGHFKEENVWNKLSARSRQKSAFLPELSRLLFWFSCQCSLGTWCPPWLVTSSCCGLRTTGDGKGTAGKGDVATDVGLAGGGVCWRGSRWSTGSGEVHEAAETNSQRHLAFPGPPASGPFFTTASGSFPCTRLTEWDF